MTDTLGKGGYSWVKKGILKRDDDGTGLKQGDAVALKFTLRDAKWTEKDEETIRTEIGALESVQKHCPNHPHVMKMFEYHEHAAYPSKGGKPLETILFVLEMAPGGELFDILFYTGKLNEKMARTYFIQLIQGLKAIHDAGVVHRDIKPQNLLLGADRTLKITDFGLSKVMECDEDSVMRTSHVGTRGFQSPEQLMRRPYDKKTDLFAAGVVLFILMTGYPPFEHANSQDYWYKDLVERVGKAANPKRFWKKHRDSGIKPQAQDFITNLLAYDPGKRFTIDQIEDSDWYNGPKMTQAELVATMGPLLEQCVASRELDVEKQLERKHSVKTRAGAHLKKEYDPSRVAPDISTSPFRGITKFETKAHPDAIREALASFMEDKGHVDDDSDNYRFKGMAQTKNDRLEFEACIYNDAGKEQNVVTINRLQGSFVNYRKFYNLLMDEALVPLNVVAED